MCACSPSRPRPGRWLQAFGDGLLPRRCVLCMAPGQEDNLCPGCRADLPRPPGGCSLCTLPWRAVTDRPCPRCRVRPPPWDRAIAALDYRFPVDALVARFKFSRQFACGAALSTALLDALVSAGRAPGESWPDCIVPVPLHWRREWWRSFNQSDLLARPVGRALRLAVRPELLRRHRHTRAQPGLGPRARRRNLHRAFVVPQARTPELVGAHLAVIDDVLTTGATLGACCRALRRAGVRRIEVWVAARAGAPPRRPDAQP